VTHCEIDDGVINAAKEYLPSISKAFSDPRLNLVVSDGVAFVEKAAEGSFDIMIVDSSDPVGPAEGLFSSAFYAKAHRILSPGGVLCAQGECLWMHAELIENMMKDHAAPFTSAEYASIQMPTYPAGQIGAFLVRKAEPAAEKDASCRVPRRPVPKDMELRYYTEEMHAAAFALPAFLRSRLSKNGDDSKPPSKRRCLAWEQA